MKKIVFLLDSISQPRCLRRIRSFIDKGYSVDVYGINRNKYNLNADSSNFKINIIGKQMQGKEYFQKLLQNNKEIRRILRKYKDDNVIYYSFGMPLTFSLFFNGGQNYIYEIADILYGYKKFDKIRWLIKKLDLLLIKNSLSTILTSEGFGKFFFKDNWPDNIIIQPNKIDSSILSLPKIPSSIALNSSSIIFSFIGGFRSPNTIFRFAQVIGEQYPNHQFHFFGDSSLTKDVIKLSELYDNVKYFGAFKNPVDLNNIYSKIDVVVSCYDISDFNERILESNKLYESLYFQKPIVVSKNTFLAERVNDFGCGFAIDASKDDAIISFIESLSTEKLEKIKSNISKINFDEIIDDNSAKIISYLEKHLQ